MEDCQVRPKQSPSCRPYIQHPMPSTKRSFSNRNTASMPPEYAVAKRVLGAREEDDDDDDHDDETENSPKRRRKIKVVTAEVARKWIADASESLTDEVMDKAVEHVNRCVYYACTVEDRSWVDVTDAFPTILNRRVEREGYLRLQARLVKEKCGMEITFRTRKGVEEDGEDQNRLFLSWFPVTVPLEPLPYKDMSQKEMEEREHEDAAELAAKTAPLLPVVPRSEPIGELSDDEL